jgi:hypothetical protein
MMKDESLGAPPSRRRREGILAFAGRMSRKRGERRETRDERLEARG